ncbi:MAG: hypothetical protein IJR04_10265 [Bacteroidales bacterium]|nr:hypothetical protein [Bacteroidales bacterium]
MGKEMIDYWSNEYWQKLQDANYDSEDKLDTKLFAVSSGAIGLLLSAMSFTEKHQAICLAIYATISFGISIILNIVYHFIAMSNHQKQFDEISNLINSGKEDDAHIRKIIKRGNKCLFAISIFSMVFILAGFVLFSIYIKANIH